MNFRDALIYFRDRSDYERGFISNPFAGDDAAAAGLRRTRLLLDELGSPDRAYPIIHVAGTKGKGSTCAFIESVARRRGLSTGMFVTPQLHSVRERTQLSGQPVTEEEFADTMRRVADAVERVEAAHPQLGSLTAFEISTAQSLLAFADAVVDLAIVEVGLGGRLDATNVVEPRVSVITPISYDHQAILGDTLPEIAAEKAGIIKPGVPVVVGPQAPEALSTIDAIARERNAPLLLAGRDWSTSWDAGRSSLSGPWGDVVDVQLGLRGPHQADNASAALMALWTFDPGLFVDAPAILTGLEAANWPGRYELVSEAPAVLVDGAHNAASMEVLVETLRADYGVANFIFVFGSYRDKDLTGMLAALKPLTPSIIATRSRSPRARDPEEIASVARERGYAATTAPSVAAALDLAVDRAATTTVIVATGSLSVVAEAREHFRLADVSPDEREILSG